MLLNIHSQVGQKVAGSEDPLHFISRSRGHRRCNVTSLPPTPEDTSTTSLAAEMAAYGFPPNVCRRRTSWIIIVAFCRTYRTTAPWILVHSAAMASSQVLSLSLFIALCVCVVLSWSLSCLGLSVLFWLDVARDHKSWTNSPWKLLSA